MSLSDSIVYAWWIFCRHFSLSEKSCVTSPPTFFFVFLKFLLSFHHFWEHESSSTVFELQIWWQEQHRSTCVSCLELPTVGRGPAWGLPERVMFHPLPWTSGTKERNKRRCQPNNPSALPFVRQCVEVRNERVPAYVHRQINRGTDSPAERPVRLQIHPFVPLSWISKSRLYQKLALLPTYDVNIWRKQSCWQRTIPFYMENHSSFG